MQTSVLMSVYQRVIVTELKQCLASLEAQTRAPDQIVIVVDGPIDPELQRTLDEFATNSSSDVTLVPLDENVGLSRALNAGLPNCSGDWILRMDADDISMPNRFEAQLRWLEQNPHVDLLGTSMLEFSENPRSPERLKPTRESHDDIVKSMPLRNPINHPTICMRKSLVEQAGGYPELPLLEDYFLWAQLAKAGARFHNLPEPYYLFRFDDATLARRSGADNFRNETWLRRWMLDAGLASLSTYWLASAMQLVLRFAPQPIQRWLWHRSRHVLKAQLDLPDSI